MSYSAFRYGSSTDQDIPPVSENNRSTSDLSVPIPPSPKPLPPRSKSSPPKKTLETISTPNDDISIDTEEDTGVGVKGLDKDGETLEEMVKGDDSLNIIVEKKKKPFVSFPYKTRRNGIILMTLVISFFLMMISAKPEYTIMGLFTIIIIGVVLLRAKVNSIKVVLTYIGILALIFVGSLGTTNLHQLDQYSSLMIITLCVVYYYQTKDMLALIPIIPFAAWNITLFTKEYSPNLSNILSCSISRLIG